MSKPTVKGLIQGYRSGALSPLTVLEDALEQISLQNPALNIFLCINKEGAREAAKSASNRLLKGEKNPFLGLPVCIPDSLNFPPFPTTYGSLLFKENIPKESAPEVKRMLDAGVLVLGKTNLSEFGLDPETQNSLLAPTRNPLDPALSSGGPNGASAAAVAAGICPLSFSTDFSGSIRISSCFCGVVGFLPTRGVLPISSSFYLPLTERQLLRKGLIAHTVEDIEIIFCALLGRSPLDAPEKFTLGLSPDLGLLSLDSEMSGKVRGCVENFKDRGYFVKPVLAGLDSSILIQFQTLVSVDRWLIIEGFLEKKPLLSSSLGAVTKQWMHYAEEVSGVSYAYAEMCLEWTKEKIDRVLQECDFLVTAACPTGPYPIGEIPSQLKNSLVDVWAQTLPFNMSGHPVVSFGGLQIVGSHGSDLKLLAAAKLLFAALLPVK